MNGPLDAVVTGQVLYRLGRELGRRLGADAPLSCTHLLQQDAGGRPLHACFGPTLAGIRLLEFERVPVAPLADRRKRLVLAAALRRQPDLRALSRRIHWYLEPLPATEGGGPMSQALQFSASPYLDHVGRGDQGDRVDRVTRTGRSAGVDPVIDLVDGLVTEALEALERPARDDAALVEAYLATVGCFAGRARVAAGLLVAIDRRAGIQWIDLEDIRNLRHPPDRLIAQARRPRLAPVPPPLTLQGHSWPN